MRMLCLACEGGQEGYIIFSYGSIRRDGNSTAFDATSADITTFRDVFLAIALALCAVAGFKLLVSGANVLDGFSSIRLLVLMGVAAAGAIWRRHDLPLALYAVVVALNLDSMIYLAGIWRTYSLDLPMSLANMVWVPLAFGILAFFRPALVVVPAIAVHWSKTHISNGGAGSVDYIIIPDLAILAATFLAVLTFYRLCRKALGQRETIDVATRFDRLFFVCCFFVLAGVHLSNYFYSGLQKLVLPGAGPLTWVLENPTYMLAVHTKDFSYLTLPTLVQHADQIFSALKLTNIPMNAAVLAAQLLAVVILLSTRASAVLTVFYDLMHLAIFALTAIFFWKWVILNAGFVFAFDAMRRHGVQVPKQIRLFGCAIVLIAPWASFNIAYLAWFDTPAVNAVSMQAVTKYGQHVPVPTNFFLDNSLAIAQQRYAGAFPGYFPTRTWGTTADANLMRRLIDDCPAEAAQWDAPSTESLARISRLLHRSHERALQLSGDGSGRFFYDLYPHHIWSAPWAYPDFSRLDLRNVKSYVLMVEGRCVAVADDGEITKKTVGKSQFEFLVADW